MSEKNGVFSAHNLDDGESIIIPNKKVNSDRDTGSDIEQKEASSPYLRRPGDIDGPDEQRPPVRPPEGPAKAADYPWFDRLEFVRTQLRTEPIIITIIPMVTPVSSYV